MAEIELYKGTPDNKEPYEEAHIVVSSNDRVKIYLYEDLTVGPIDIIEIWIDPAKLRP